VIATTKNGQRRGDRFATPQEALDQLLKVIELSKTTGDAYLRLTCLEGGVRMVRTAVESPVRVD